jgi:hypothetical protein
MSETDSKFSPRSHSDLLSELLKLLTHEIRSPLSILSNDLAYVCAKYSQKDLSTSKEAIKTSVEILSLIESLPSPSTKGHHCTLAEIVEELTPQLSSTPIEYCETGTVPFDLKSLLPSLNALLINILSDSKSLEIATSTITIVITAKQTSNHAHSNFLSLRFPLKASAAPIRLALAELYLNLNGVQIAATSDNLRIIIAYDAPKDTPR